MVEAPRNLQLPSGYDEEFVYKVEDDFICLICQLPLKEPVQTRCGHRFCNACFEEHLRRQEVQNQPYTCPADRKGLDRDRDIFPDNATGRKILSLVIKCPSDGCSWTGELRNKEAHLEACPFKIVTCNNENCHVAVKRKDLEQHVTNSCEWRIIECEYCEDLHPKRHLQDHLENCSKIPLPCPNSCGNVIPREMIPNHIDTDCPSSLVSCPYAQMGCNEKFQRKNVDSHLHSNMPEHLEFMCVKLNSTQVQLNEQRVLLVERLDQLVETRDQLDKTRAQLNETRVQLYEKRVQLAETEAKLSRFEDGHQNRFIWKIKSFSESMNLVQEGVKERIESDSFYTRHGYKLKVFVRPLLFDKNQVIQIEMGIVLMEGNYDDLLPWPFSKKIMFTIIDQNKDLKRRENHIFHLIPSKTAEGKLFSKRPGKKRNTVESHLKIYLSSRKPNARTYLENDTLFLQVDVVPDD